MNFRRKWRNEYNSDYVALREKETDDSPDPHAPLPLPVRLAIQKDIKATMDYRSWWMWEDNHEP